MNTLSDKQREALARLAGLKSDGDPKHPAYFVLPLGSYILLEDWLRGELDMNPLALYQLSLVEAKLPKPLRMDYGELLADKTFEMNEMRWAGHLHGCAIATAPASIRARALLELIGEE